MSMLLRPFLLLAVLGRALWLRTRGRTSPEPEGADRWQGRFRLAVWLCLAMLPATAQDLQEPALMCYDMAPPLGAPTLPLSRVRVLWMALDPQQGRDLAAALAAAARAGDVEVKVSNLLVRIHTELAEHHERTRVQQITCYKMTEAGARQMGHRESALAQLEALAKVKQAGHLAPEVLASAEALLRTELAQLGLKPAPNAKELEGATRILTTWYSE
jgi:hypothetical protein